MGENIASRSYKMKSFGFSGVELGALLFLHSKNASDSKLCY